MAILNRTQPVAMLDISVAALILLLTSGACALQFKQELTSDGWSYIPNDQLEFGIDNQNKLCLSGGIKTFDYTNAGPGSSLIMQDDGNLVLKIANGGDAVYASGTEGNHRAWLFLDSGLRCAKILAVNDTMLMMYLPMGCIDL